MVDSGGGLARHVMIKLSIVRSCTFVAEAKTKGQVFVVTVPVNLILLVTTVIEDLYSDVLQMGCPKTRV